MDLEEHTTLLSPTVGRHVSPGCLLVRASGLDRGAFVVKGIQKFQPFIKAVRKGLYVVDLSPRDLVALLGSASRDESPPSSAAALFSVVFRDVQSVSCVGGYLSITLLHQSLAQDSPNAPQKASIKWDAAVHATCHVVHDNMRKGGNDFAPNYVRDTTNGIDIFLNQQGPNPNGSNIFQATYEGETCQIECFSGYAVNDILAVTFTSSFPPTPAVDTEGVVPSKCYSRVFVVPEVRHVTTTETLHKVEMASGATTGRSLAGDFMRAFVSAQQRGGGSNSGTDVTFLVEGQPVRAHKAVLAIRSPVFSAWFYGAINASAQGSEALKDNASGESTKITVESWSHASFLEMIRFIYTDCIESTPQSPDVACEVVALAEEYDIPGLKELAQTTVEQALEEGNVVGILRFAIQYQLGPLVAACKSFIRANAKVMRRCDEVKELSSSSVAATDVECTLATLSLEDQLGWHVCDALDDTT